MARPSQKEILDFWKENVARERKSEHYDLCITFMQCFSRINSILFRNSFALESLGHSNMSCNFFAMPSPKHEAHIC